MTFLYLDKLESREVNICAFVLFSLGPDMDMLD